MEKLTLFFDRIKSMTFIQRIFGWNNIKNLSYDAYGELKELEQRANVLNDQHGLLKEENAGLKKDKEHTDEQLNQATGDLRVAKSSIDTAENVITKLNTEVKELEKSLSGHNATKEQRQDNYDKQIAGVTKIREALQEERQRLADERVQEKADEFEAMKLTWAEHEVAVEHHMRGICNEHIITYLDSVPFKGKPDNAIEICGETIIFDAKSPANDDLTNFPKYITLQAEQAKKYAKQENVKRDIFLVIPSNTSACIRQTTFNMGDYTVYVVTLDALEPIVLSLKRVEEYEFAEKLSPEDRDSICRIIGKFAHTTKRRVQVDQFFTRHMLGLLKQADYELPEEMKAEIFEFEKAEKLNPSVERRKKQITIKGLEDEHNKLNSEAQIDDIAIPESFQEVKELEK